ncbi:hypothetical protein CIW47_25960 [Mycolicibacterium sp. P1-5]|nr:hypothetical protein CIW47_25960 [Mycolicibacterium sp. P1-5]
MVRRVSSSSTATETVGEDGVGKRFGDRCCGGRDSFERFLDISVLAWKKIIDINLHGVFHTISGSTADATPEHQARHDLSP